MQYCAGWVRLACLRNYQQTFVRLVSRETQIRPTENQFLAVSPEVLRTIESKALLDMLGYSIYPPFTGYGRYYYTLESGYPFADGGLQRMGCTPE